MRTQSAILALPLLAALLPAQGEYDFDKTTPGTLGATLGFRYANAAPNKTLLFCLSATTGPTPLSQIDPADPRVLEVGLESASLWFVTGTGGTGAGTFNLSVPVDPSLQGALVHFQTLTAPGTTRLIDQVSNRATVHFGAAGSSATLPSATLTTARALMGAFFHRPPGGGRGDVVLAGGGQGSLLGATGSNVSEIYDFRRMRVRAGPNLSTARALSVAVPLADGRVLIAGGVDATGAALASAEIYDPATNAFTPTGAMSVARAGHAGALLGNGRVMVVGGTTTFSDPIAALANAQSSAETYNPATGTWSAAPAMNARRLAPSLDALKDGRALVSGGFQVNVVLGFPIPVGSVATCQVFSTATNAWAAAASMPTDRAVHSLNTVLLGDGRLLVTGGARSGPDLTQAAATDRCDLYDPAANAWTPLPSLPSARTGHSASLLPDGRVVLAGGAQGTLTAPVAIGAVDVYLPGPRTFQARPALQTTRSGHAAFVTPDGLLVLAGGAGGAGNTTLASFETIHP